MMLVRLSLVLVGLMGALGAVGCSEEEEAAQEFLPPVSVALVESVDLKQEIRASGDLRARFHTTIAAEVEGRITGISIEEGGSVEKDAIVLEIDPARRKLDVGAARARVAQSNANKIAKEQQPKQARIRQATAAQNVASDQQLEEAETALLPRASSSVEADRAAPGRRKSGPSPTRACSAPFAGLDCQAHGTTRRVRAEGRSAF